MGLKLEGSLLFCAFCFSGEEFGEVGLHAEGSFAFSGDDALGGAIGEDERCVLIIAEAGLEDFDESLSTVLIANWKHEFDALTEIPVHPVGGGDEDFFGSFVVEGEDAHVLEVLINNRDDLDIFARDEAADAADVE